LANDQTGSTGTWETLSSPSKFRLGRPARINSLALGGTPPTEGANTWAKRWYRQAKHTKRGEMDGKESQRPIGAVKPGNDPPDPVEQRGRRVVDRELAPRRGHRTSPACHRETAQSCEGQRFHNVTNRMPLTGTSGSVGAPGSNPWGYPARNPGPRARRGWHAAKTSVFTRRAGMRRGRAFAPARDASLPEKASPHVTPPPSPEPVAPSRKPVRCHAFLTWPFRSA
jgi:hypothetical protein